MNANQKTLRKLREDVISGYGGKCACCGEWRYEFLSLDHVNGGGTASLRRSGNNMRAHYRDARNRSCPPDYRLLCHNCNFSIGHYGYCPHQPIDVVRHIKETWVKQNYRLEA